MPKVGKSLAGCLVVSQNGDGECIDAVLQEMGFTSFKSGNGHEGVAAIGRYQPKLIVLFFRPEDEEDVLVFRAVQAFSQSQFFPAVIVSPDAWTAERLLGPKRWRCRWISVLACVSYNRLMVVSDASLKQAIQAILRPHRRSKKIASAAVPA